MQAFKRSINAKGFELATLMRIGDQASIQENHILRSWRPCVETAGTTSAQKKTVFTLLARRKSIDRPALE